MYSILLICQTSLTCLFVCDYRLQGDTWRGGEGIRAKSCRPLLLICQASLTCLLVTTVCSETHGEAGRGIRAKSCRPLIINDFAHPRDGRHHQHTLKHS